MKTSMTLVWLALIGATAGAAVFAAAPSPLTHVETITAGRREYVIHMRGTMDGPSTRTPIGYSPWSQTFEPNKTLTLTNVGDTVVVNPWVFVNGKRNWRTVQDIVAEAVAGCRNDRERARAVWWFEINHRYHSTTSTRESVDPVKVYNVYGYTLCGDDAQVIADLWRTAGLKTRRARPQGHCISEVFYDNSWHLLDGDESVICLLRDNKTIGSERHIVDDHDLIKRTHTYGILHSDVRKTDEFSASLYVYEGQYGGEYASHIGHKMHMQLRPGEALTWSWAKATKGFPYPNGNNKPNRCQGLWRYAPDLSKPAAKFAMESQANAAFGDGKSPALRPKEPGKPSRVTFKVSCPYVIVGGRIAASGVQRDGSQLTFELSLDGKHWSTVEAKRTGDRVALDAAIDPHLKPANVARYQCWLRVGMKAGRAADDVGLDRVAIEADLQMAALSLPSLELGDNRVLYVDETKGPRRVRISHKWVESSASRAPAAPPAPVFPADGAAVEGARFTFKWQPPADPDGDAIADYHFQLSDRADMRWPLSPNFNKLISKTASKGKAEWTVPYVGLLNPGETYYWRVRARDAKGVWSGWSAVWRFTPQGPGVPIPYYPRLDHNARTVTLRWRANSQGRPPVRYKVYGSNEKGFTASDAPYTMLVNNVPAFGGQTKRAPANLIGETTALRMVVAGPACAKPNMNKAFYRVVAVDAKGVASGPSDLIAVRRPFICTKPALRAVVGRRYEYRVGALLSIGDLRSRTFDRSHLYNAHFWDVDEPRFYLLSGPSWLSMDRASGLLSGTPAAGDVGKVKVGVLVDVPKVAVDAQQFELEVAAKP